jgi:hypothetical protein
MKRRTLDLFSLVAAALFLSGGNAPAQTHDQSKSDMLTLDQVFFVTSPKWYLLRGTALEDDILIFRKYSIPVVDWRVAARNESPKKYFRLRLSAHESAFRLRGVSFSRMD